MRRRLLCRGCGHVRQLQLVDTNDIGRPVWMCPDGHTQAGPFASRNAVAADGGEQR